MSRKDLALIGVAALCLIVLGVAHQASNLGDWSGDVEARRRPWWRRIIGG